MQRKGTWLLAGVGCLLWTMGTAAQQLVAVTPPATEIERLGGADRGSAVSALRTQDSGLIGAADGWSVTPVFTGGFTIGIAVGAGRNDEVPRLYATEITADRLREFTFDGEAWSNTFSIALPFYSEKSLVLADGRGDGALRLYVGEFGQAGGVREYTWDSEAWSGATLPGTGQQLINVAAGDGRGDGALRLYFSAGSSPPTNVAREFWYSGTAWTEAPIPSPPGIIVGSFGIAAGDGRNDGIVRVYQGVLGVASFQVYEHTWNGTGWDAELVADTGSGPGAQIMGVAVGDGQNDGTNRVYVVRRGVGVNEYTYTEGAWSQTNQIPVGAELFGIAMGPGRSDGLNRLYIPQFAGTLWEASFGEDGWAVAPAGAPGGSLFHVAVGDARGDGLSRVYAAGGGGLFEFERKK